MSKNLITLMMKDGVDMEVINDVVTHPTKYIQMLSFDIDLYDPPMYCFFHEDLLTADQKTNVLAYLDRCICDWYMWEDAMRDFGGNTLSIPDIIDDIIDDEASEEFSIDDFLDKETVEYLLSTIEDCPLDFA